MEWTIEDRCDGKNGPLSYVTYEDGSPIAEETDIDLLLDHLEWRITTEILRNLGHYVQLHAAGLVTEKRALLLVGPSGAGKSSLALSLLLQGWKCLSDEVILVDAESPSVWPFPRSFRVGFKTLSLFPGLGTGQACADMGKRRLDPALVLDSWATGPSMPGWIIFPNYHPSHQGDLIPLGETEALTLLLGQAINLVDHGKKGLDILTQLVRHFRCFRLNTGDLNVATSVLVRLTKQGHGAPCASDAVHK